MLVNLRNHWKVSVPIIEDGDDVNVEFHFSKEKYDPLSMREVIDHLELQITTLTDKGEIRRLADCISSLHCVGDRSTKFAGFEADVPSGVVKVEYIDVHLLK